MVQMRHGAVLPGQRFLAYKCMTEDLRGLIQALVENDLFSIWQKYHYPDLRLALGQSGFPVEVSLHDDAAMPVLSGAKILGKPLCP
jgi:hypothetical protein